MEEETAQQPVVSGSDARQKTERSLHEPNIQGDFIIIDDIGSLKNETKQFSELKLQLKTMTKQSSPRWLGGTLVTLR